MAESDPHRRLQRHDSASDSGAIESTPAPSSIALSTASPRRGPSTLRVLAILLGVFAFGGLAGGFAGRAFTLGELRKTIGGPPGEARTKMRLDAMRRDLDLSDDQVARIASIMKAGEPDRDAAMKACRPDLEALREKSDAAILEVLTPEQKPKYQELAAKRRQR